MKKKMSRKRRESGDYLEDIEEITKRAAILMS